MRIREKSQGVVGNNGLRQDRIYEDDKDKNETMIIENYGKQVFDEKCKEVKIKFVTYFLEHELF